VEPSVDAAAVDVAFLASACGNEVDDRRADVKVQYAAPRATDSSTTPLTHSDRKRSPMWECTSLKHTVQPGRRNYRTGLRS